MSKRRQSRSLRSFVRFVKSTENRQDGLNSIQQIKHSTLTTLYTLILYISRIYLSYTLSSKLLDSLLPDSLKISLQNILRKYFDSARSTYTSAPLTTLYTIQKRTLRARNFDNTYSLSRLLQNTYLSKLISQSALSNELILYYAEPIRLSGKSQKALRRRSSCKQL